LFVSFLAFMVMFVSPHAIAQDWQEIYEEDAVKVSRAEIEGSKLFAFKGETVYDVPISKVLWVLMDNDHRIEWVDRLYTNHVIERSGPYDYVLYQAFELPAIFSDRDYVYHGKMTKADDGVVTLTMQSIEHPEAPETVGVRAELINSRYILTPMGDNQTRIEVEIITDPKGMMPNWLTNLVQKSWPVETLNGIRGQFVKDHMGDFEPPPSAKEAAEAEAAAKAAEEAAAAETEEAAEGEEGAEGEAGAEGEEGADGAEAEEATDEEAAPAE